MNKVSSSQLTMPAQLTTIAFLKMDNKNSEIINKIAQEVLKIKNMETNEFIEHITTNIYLKYENLLEIEIDNRVKKFFHYSINKVETSLNDEMPIVSNFLNMVGQAMRQQEFRRKFVEGISFELIKDLMNDLDKINPAIVDAMIKN